VLMREEASFHGALLGGGPRRGRGGALLSRGRGDGPTTSRTRRLPARRCLQTTRPRAPPVPPGERHRTTATVPALPLPRPAPPRPAAAPPPQTSTSPASSPAA
jgi:hypothetical protein